jgi:hypothetical protein
MNRLVMMISLCITDGVRDTPIKGSRAPARLYDCRHGAAQCVSHSQCAIDVLTKQPFLRPHGWRGIVKSIRFCSENDVQTNGVMLRKARRRDMVSVMIAPWAAAAAIQLIWNGHSLHTTNWFLRSRTDG